MKSPPWFRFYSEILSDRKIERITRWTGQAKMSVIGAWAIVMALANDSPIRGVLLLTEDIPLVDADLADEMGVDMPTVKELLDSFQRLNMIHQEDGVYHITNWGNRQFASDSSTARVQAYRERQQEQESSDEPSDAVTAEDGECNVTETLQERDSNVPETETDPEQNQRQIQTQNKDLAGKPAQTRARASPGGLSEGQREWLGAFGAKRFANNVQRDAVLALEQAHGTDVLLQGIAWAAKQGMSMGRAVTSLETALPKWGKSGDKNGVIRVGR